MSEKPKVLFCTDGIFPESVGGMQRHSNLLICELYRHNRVQLSVIHPHSKLLFTDCPGIKEYALNFSFSGNYLRSCFKWSELVASIALSLPDHVIYSQGLSVWSGLKELGKRTIVNPHGLEPFQTISREERFKTLPLRLAERYIFRKASKVVSLGGRLTEIIEKEAGKQKIVVLPNAVNIQSPVVRDFEKDPLDLLFVGRFAFNKGINILMEAVSQLNREGYERRLRFHLVGKGPLYESYRKEYNLANVVFYGFAGDDQLMELYRTLDLFVFPTRFEGMPTVVLEAMAAGMPIIVSDTGATAELTDRTNGFLVETNNVRSLKWAIQSYYHLSSSEKSQLSAKSIEKVKSRFTWEKVAAAHADLFENFKIKE